MVSAPDAVVASILDLDYKAKPKGYAWGTRTNVSVSISLPAWLARARSISVTQVRDGLASAVPSTRAGGVVTATIPSLTVGTLLVFEPVP